MRQHFILVEKLSYSGMTFSKLQRRKLQQTAVMVVSLKRGRLGQTSYYLFIVALIFLLNRANYINSNLIHEVQ